jgi:hypothetical protein
MVYGTGDIPVGDYDKTRLANLGLGHGAIDGGVGYAYLYLLKIIANSPDIELLRQEVSRARVEMEVEAVLVLGARVLEIVGHPNDRRELKFVRGIDSFVCATTSGRGRRCVGSARRDLRHCRRRRQEHQQHQHRAPKSGDRQFGSQVHDQILNGKTGEATSE